MDPQAQQQPVPPQQSPQTSSLASSFSLGKTVIISLGVLGLGLAIAYGGFYFGTMSKKSPQATIYPSPTSQPSVTQAVPTSSPSATTTHYVNTQYGYSLDYPKGLQLQGQGMQVTDATAPDVMITTDVTKASPDPKHVFFIRALDKTLLTVNSKPISSYTLLDLVAMDLATNVNNKNIYVSTLSPVTKLQPLPVGTTDGYTFSVRTKGFETVYGGALWDLGDYVVTEFDSPKYHYLLVYSNTDEMKQVAMTMKFK